MILVDGQQGKQTSYSQPHTITSPPQNHHYNIDNITITSAHHISSSITLYITHTEGTGERKGERKRKGKEREGKENKGKKGG